MPVYNGMPYLREAVDSILSQTEQRFNLVVIDDGSTDRTVDYLNTINSSKIKVYSIGRQGLISALNFGINLIETEYFAIMDSDDVSDPDRFKFQLNFLNNNKDFVAVGTSIKYITTLPSDRYWQVKMPSDNQVIKKGLNNGRFVLCQSTIMIRTSAIKKIGGYIANDDPIPDLGLFLRLSKEGKLSNLENCFCFVRLHNDSFTSKNLNLIVKKINTQVKNSNNSLFILNFISKLDYLSVLLYRRAIFEYLKQNTIFSVLFFIIAGLFNPSRAIYFLKVKWH
jgi:glycosyltransferase involved in cell wall biosynthesis